MFARNFTVKLNSSLKSNFVVIPESYRKLIATCKTGCLLLNYCSSSGQYKTVYVSWSNTIRASTPFEIEEIEVNTTVGELWGLKNGMSVSCSVIQNAQPLKSITISLGGEDYEMAECSSDKIQYEMLDQISIVGRYQPLILWLNKSITVRATVDNLCPSFNYGRIQNDTELLISRKDFLRTKPSVASSEADGTNAKMKRRSAVERSETLDLSQLRRNNSFSDSRRLLEKPADEYNGRSSFRRESNGWSSNILDVTDKKPPLLSPRNSIKKSKDTSSFTDRLNPLSVSSSASSIRRMQDDMKEKEVNEISNSLSATNIKRVQEKSKQFLEALDTAPKQQKRHVMNSISNGNIPSILTESSPSSAVVRVEEPPMKIVEKRTVEKRLNHRQYLEDLKITLTKETRRRIFVKSRFDEKNTTHFMQINEVFVAKSSRIDVNQIHKLQTKNGKEYHVRVKLSEKINDDETMEMHPVLAKILDLDESGEKVRIFEVKLACNLVEAIEIVPTNAIEGGLGHQIARDIEEKFKKYVNANSRVRPLILNQDQIFKLDDYLVTIKLMPPSLPVCCVDSEILRESVIEVKREGAHNEHSASLRMENSKKRNKSEVQKKIKFDKQDQIILDTCKLIHPPSNAFNVPNNEQNNLILVGTSNSGKKTICSEIKNILESRGISVTVFNCSEHKGRKVESIIRDMRSYLMNCLALSPSIFVIYNLDSIAAFSQDEQATQETEYLKKLSNNIRHLLEQFTHDYGSYISVLVTLEKLSGLNKILYHEVGYYVFKNVMKIPNLEVDDRLNLLKKLFSNNDLNFDKIDWDKFSKNTEGYQIGDICHFAKRAIFFAIKENHKKPTLNEEMMNRSLDISNNLCLQGIKTHTKSDDKIEDINEKIPGMDDAISTLTEVLIWPTKFPKIFQNSPLRNQAGVLLFGLPGTGKTFIISQITKRWNLRMISIKGPELLAKYIGQSEENVRNLFEKAKSAAPCVLFFDEFDSLAPRRGHDSTGVTDRVVNQFLTELDGVKSLKGVTVICATSRPDLIDPALLRSGRIDRYVECQLPNANERYEILKWLSKSLKVDSKIDLKAIAVKLENFSGADIKSVLTTASMHAMQSQLEALSNDQILDEVFISSEQMERSISETRPSLTLQDITRYKMLYEKFKSKKSVTTDTPKKVSLA